MQPLAVAVAIPHPHPHPPHNSGSSSGPVVQHSLIHALCIRPSDSRSHKEELGEPNCERVNTTFYRTAHLDFFPPNLRPAQSCLTPRDLATICPSFVFVTHRTAKTGGSAISTCLPLAWHGMDSGWRSGVARGEFCLSFTVFTVPWPSMMQSVQTSQDMTRLLKRASPHPRAGLTRPTTLQVLIFFLPVAHMYT